jgi:methyl-accepting chemotaxis protein
MLGGFVYQVIPERGDHTLKNASHSSSLSNLGLQAKIQIVVHSFILVLFTIATVVLSESIKTIILDSVRLRAEGVANAVIDSANMLMETGEISEPENRKLLIRKIASSGNIVGLRLVRAEQVARQFGPGLPEEQIKDDVERAAIQSKQPSYTLEDRNGVPVFRAVTPYIVSHNFHGTDCLNCHSVEVGSVNGASDVDIDLTSDFTKLHRIILWLVVGQLLVQFILFFLIRWVVRRFVIHPLNEAVAIADGIASGNLTQRIEVKTGDDVGRLLQALKDMNESLGRIVSEVREATESITVTAKEIAQGNSDLSQRTEEQASSLEETASSMEQLTSTVKQNAENARHANQLATSASDIAIQGGQAVDDVVQTMASISASSKKIGDIISVIEGIAFQTNILALNAAVEAARAGEQGRGFAVVAAEVRNLAQRSAAAAKEITTLIAASVDKVETGTKQVDQAGATMHEVVNAVKRVTDIMAEISAASHEQSSGIEEVNKAIVQMDNVTQQNAALVEEAAAAAESMQGQSDALHAAVNVFKVVGDDERTTRYSAKKAALKTDRTSVPLHAATKPVKAPSPGTPELAKIHIETEEEWKEF